MTLKTKDGITIMPRRASLIILCLLIGIFLIINIFSIYVVKKNINTINTIEKNMYVLEQEVDSLVLENDYLKDNIYGINMKLDSNKTDIEAIHNNYNESNLFLENEIEQNIADVQMMKDLIFGKTLFDKEAVQVGDELGEFIVKEIYKNNKDFIITFDGSARIYGYFGLTQDNTIIFILNEFGRYLPRAKNDRRIWFTFSNTEEAKKMFENHNMYELQTIIIDDFKLDLTESEVYNTARLVEVLTD